VCAINNYEQVVREQLADLEQSGLYEASEKRYIVVAGEMSSVAKVRKQLKQYPKCVIADVSAIKAYEFPTLLQLQRHAQKNDKSFYYYIHTKGVTYPNHKGGKYWRDYMMYYNVIRWQDCVAKLKDGFDTCGVKLVDNHKAFPKHYSGNFWWAKSEYILRCPPVESMKQEDRYQAEFWVCKASPNSATICQVFIDYDQNPPYK
jgi:hypothetical protein